MRNFLSLRSSSESPKRSNELATAELILAGAGPFRKRLRDDTNIIDAREAQSVYDFGENAKGDGFVGAKKDGILGLFELSFYLSAETIDVDGCISNVDELILVDRNDETDFVDFLDGRRFGDVDFDTGLQDGGGNHENNEQDENNVDERDHVDLGERALRVFGELRHSFQWPRWARGRKSLSKSFLDLGSDFKGKGVEALRQIANVLQKVIVEDNRRNGHEKTRRGGNESFGDAWCDGTKAGGAGVAKAGEGVNDAPNCAEEADEGSH